MNPSALTGAVIGLVVLGPGARSFGQTPCESDSLVALDGGPSDQFAGAVSIDGTVAVVGASGDDDGGSGAGAAYVFRFNGTDWVQEQKLTASDAAAFDEYGIAVGVSGDSIVVGAPRNDLPVGNNAGAAYVYVFNGATWDEQQRLLATGGALGDRFGHSVAIDGDTVLVGAINDDDVAANSGSGYVFTRTGTTWTEQDKLTVAIPTGTNPQLGHSAALEGDVAVLGAWQDAPAGMFSVGAAYVFRRTGTTWSQEQKLTASDAANFRWFGQSVSISGNTIAVGAFGDQAAGLGESGGAYFFTFDATWTEQDNVNASDAAANDRFGWSIALDGDTAVIGTDGASEAYLFTRTGGVWSEQTMLNSADPGVSGEYAYSVGLDAETAVIGDRSGASGNGIAFVFDLAGIDCNANGICDAKDIADGTSFDVNSNGIPDECECPEDVNGDGVTNVLDLIDLLLCFGLPAVPGCEAEDVNADGSVNVLDLIDLLLAFGTACP